MYRWTAGFLLLVMFVPGLAPLALARTAASETMHCMRLRPGAVAAQPAVHCHHGMEQAAGPESPEVSFRALDCCHNHNCCRSVKTSEWARPACIHFSVLRLLLDSALVVPAIIRGSADVIAPDSPRAPPAA
jgi:hypothetical protein